MEIEKFRIKNYRSIVDSGDCYLSPKITVLAGKNEAGKTSILEALRDFTKFRNIDDDAKPINRDSDPEIHVTFAIAPEEMQEFVPDDVAVPEEESHVTIIKSAPNNYEVKEELNDLVPAFQGSRKELGRRAKEDLIPRAVEFIAMDAEEKQSLEEESLLKVKLRKVQNSVRDAKQADEVDEKRADRLLENLEQTLNKVEDFENYEEGFENSITDKIPEFVLFSTYEDQIPNKIPFNELEDNEFVEDLAKVSDLDSSIVKSGGDRKKRQHKKEVNVELNEDYKEFWTQDDTSLSIDWDSEHLKFWIEEDGTPYMPKHRSKGKMWHLSFYIKLTAHASKENPPVVLIDDPGLHLHAKAQKDILNKLESVAETSPVIYTTHSPYLIDAEKLDRVWLVEREEGAGTEIEKLHAGADKDTLRPILTAIGANTTIGVHTDKENSVVVEGISDYHYLQAFREIVDWDKDLDIIPGTGGDSPIDIGSILFGWGVEPIFCLDSDGQGNNNREKLEEDLDIDEERIIQMPSEGDIEDVFTKDDFREYVLQDEEQEYESSNSDYLKPNRGNKDKVLLAKKFYELVRSDEDIELDDETEERIRTIFERLDQAIEGGGGGE